MVGDEAWRMRAREGSSGGGMETLQDPPARADSCKKRTSFSRCPWSLLGENDPSVTRRTSGRIQTDAARSVGGHSPVVTWNPSRVSHLAPARMRARSYVCTCSHPFSSANQTGTLGWSPAPTIKRAPARGPCLL